LPIKSDAPPDGSVVLAVKAWNMMGGKIEWAALEIVVEIIGINDIEQLLAQLEKIKKHGEKRNQD